MGNESMKRLSEVLPALSDYIATYFQGECEFSSVKTGSVVYEKTEKIFSQDLMGSSIAILGEDINVTLYCSFSSGLIQHFHKIYLMEEAEEIDEETAYGLASEVVNTIAGNITPLLARNPKDVLEITTPIHPDETKKRVPSEGSFPGIVFTMEEGECHLFILKNTQE